jgi:hypothetical protein
MARSVLIFCQNDKFINFKDIAEFVKDGWYFDECPEFNIGEESFVEIKYDPNLRPIVIELFDNPQMVEEIKQESHELYLDRIKVTSIADEEAKNEIASKIAASMNIYKVEFSWSDLSESCWEMMACVESFLAKEKQGIIVADEGAYDENIELIISFSVLL